MMDEVWSRGWAEAHKAALEARNRVVQDGRPVPTLWDGLRRLVRDLIAPQERSAPCDTETCQSAA